MTSQLLEAKIKTLDELIPIVAAHKQQHQTIVTNNGSYDILHLGHIEGLFYAKAQGDVLIVGVNSDQSVRNYKGPTRPINDEHMRLRMLAALMCVDYVFSFDETEPMTWLAQLQPHIHTNGAEYGDECIERDTVEQHGGRIVLLPMIDGYKTTSIIERIKTNC
jgi:rfaE bifunctional protein nucleotidyltransferase chain/domain